ncbi:alpha/beta fold hydrolase, partial [Pontibacter sp. JAM-7]|uniref:alpha/beta fold hydrolase n=1 Tax=Pontibacter sp. JAM-7 TaxID=3366581 RepID=UPI003AF5E3C2
MLFPDNFRNTRIACSDVEINLLQGGEGPPLLLLHGYPHTHVMWHLVAPLLAPHFHVICPDLRGYGDSCKPVGLPGHANYAKRVMAEDMVAVMQALGYQRFFVAG